MIPRTINAKHAVKLTCPCGHKSAEVVAHYDLVRCACGKFYWPLQPQRGGPLRFFPWPGPNLTADQMAGKERLAA